MNYKISIITIVYNDKFGLEKTIQSVINQTYKNIEYIIIDGGSIDGTLDIIKKYKDKIDYWISESDKGIYDAMNKGLKSANGDFILFMNSGDSFFKDSSLCNSVSKINKSRVCYIANTVQIWDNDKYMRISKVGKNIAHQGFIAPNIKGLPFFEENIKINADSIWMERCIKKYGYNYTDNILSTFALGGLSNYPTIKSIKLRFLDSGYKRGGLEIFKYILRIFFKDKYYYRILAKYNGFSKYE